MNQGNSDAMRFLDLSAQVSNDSEEETELGSDLDFVDDVDSARLYKPVRGPLFHDSDDSLSAEELANDIVERARKRRRMEITESSSSNVTTDALDRQLHTKCPLFPEGVEVDDSEYEMYYVRAKNAPVEARTFTEHFPSHCIAFHIRWMPRRVYLWVPDEQAVHDMFYKCARPGDGRRRVHVPREEHGEVFAMLFTKPPAFSVGSWVRVKTGLFAGDFGIVQETLQNGLGLKLAVMARIHDSPEVDNQGRPERRLATLPWLRQRFKTETISHHDDGTYEFRKGQYRDGLRLLRLPVWRVQSAFPELHDVLPFSLNHLGELQDVECYIQRGDVVAIHSGSLQNLVGVVVLRTGVDVVLQDVRRIVFDKDDDDNWFSRTSEDIRDDRTYWAKLRDMRREDILFEIQHSRVDESIGESCSTHLRTVRRFLDVGDEVVVKAGIHSGKAGIIVEQREDTIRLRRSGIDGFTPDEMEISVSRFWVETAVPDRFRQDAVGPFNRNWLLSSLACEEMPADLINPFQDEVENGFLFFPKDIVCIRVGKHAGRWGKVTHLEEDKESNIHVAIRGRNGQEDELIRCNKSSLYKWSWDILEHGNLPDTSSRVVYEKAARSRFVGTYVFVWRRGETALAVREAKGLFGFVQDVDLESKTARVAFQNREATLPLKSLVSADFLCCLDRDARLSPDDHWRLFQEVSKHQARHGSRVQRFLDSLLQSRTPTQAPVETENPKPMALEPVTDFSQPGFWVLRPDVRRFYPGFKVFVRSSKQDRAGYITGSDIGEDHSRCFGSHDKCTVRVHIVRGTLVSETALEISDLEPCRPVKKKEKVIQIRGLEGAPVRMLVATSVPKQRDQQLTVCLPDNEKRTWYIPGSQVTKIENR